jgi:transcriptional regulator
MWVYAIAVQGDQTKIRLMYCPSAFRLDDRAKLLAHAACYPFATLITHDEGSVDASHVPLLVDAERGELRGHLARENAQLRHIGAGAHVLAIFHGPHGFVSPSVYLDPGVPTWNFVVVHARGRARLVDDAGLRTILDETVARFDTSSWRASVGEDYLTRMRGGIVGFAVTIESLEGKWKLSQNRSAADRERVIEFLERGDASSREVAAMMRERGD